MTTVNTRTPIRTAANGLAILLSATFAFAQQTGRIEGAVTLHEVPTLAGIAVVAESDIMPRPRSTVTDANGHPRS